MELAETLLSSANKFMKSIRLKYLLGTEFISSYGRSLSGSRVNFYTDDPVFSYLSNGGVGGQSIIAARLSTLPLYSIFTRLDYASGKNTC